jgi:hypothetical protein
LRRSQSRIAVSCVSLGSGRVRRPREELLAMMPPSAKSIAPRPSHHAASEAVKATTPAERRAAMEAQKRYMDERFGRNRPMGRKPTA